MLPRELWTGSAGGFTCLLLSWVTLTLISSVAGSLYVKATLDCLTPALLAQASVALLSSIRTRLGTLKKDAAAEPLLVSSGQHPHIQDQHPGFRSWVLALGVLHLLSSILTLASFGLSSVANTYIIRTLEPIMSCCLLYLLHGQRRSLLELLLLAVVAGATACVVLMGNPADKPLVLSSLLHASDAAQQLKSLQMPGSAMPVLLAVGATLTISCRSVASKTVAVWTGTSEFDTFLEASTPGLIAAALLQGGLWVMFGPQLARGVSSSSSWLPAAPVALVVCALSQCAYSAVSFKVLQQCSPVVHGMLNVLKRVFIIMGCAALLGRPLTALQLLGITVANAAAAAFAVHQAAPAAGASSHLSIGGLIAAGKDWAADGSSRDRRRTGCAGHGKAHPPSAQTLSRLVSILAVTILFGALLLASVLSVFGSQLVSQQQQLAVPAGWQQQHGGSLSQFRVRVPMLLQQQWQQHQQDPLAAGTKAQLPASWPRTPASSIDEGLFDSSSTRHSNNSSSSDDVGSSGSSNTEALPQHVRDFVVREFGRIQCLTALHETSKASLAPFLHNRSSGGVALFDVALHKNLGDAVLWAAAARLVPSFHESVKYVCAQTQYPGKVNKLEARRAFPKCNTKHMMRAIGPKGVVLLAPGGNWGDLWWTVHGQRLKYLPEIAAASRAAGSAVQLVQLPQSLTFTTNHKALEDEQVINALPPGMLTLFTRQQDSLEYAHTHYPDTNALLAPDLAFSLGPLMPGTAKYDVLFLMRQDKEAAHSETPLVTVVQPRGGQPGAQPASEAGAGAQAGADQAAAGAASKEDQDEVDEALQQLQQLGLTYAIREWQFEHENYSKEVSKVALVQVAESRLQGAIDIISLGKVVVTNRLHAAIVANLLGRPLVWIDTRHKKLSGVRSLAFSYSAFCNEANMHSAQAASFSEAVKTAAAWLQSPDFIWSAQQVDAMT